jgi:anti-sigma factor RsiW
LSADLDGELPADESVAVRHHILTCADCARTRSQLETTRWAFRAIALEPVGDKFDDGVFRRLREEHGLRWWFPAAAGVAAALAIVLLLRAPRPASGIVDGSPTPALVSSDLPPGWSDGPAGAAADCARSGAVVCHVETPCADGRCRSAAVAAFTDIR